MVSRVQTFGMGVKKVNDVPQSDILGPGIKILQDVSQPHLTSLSDIELTIKSKDMTPKSNSIHNYSRKILVIAEEKSTFDTISRYVMILGAKDICEWVK